MVPREPRTARRGPFTTGAPGRHWVCHEWLSQLAFALIDRASGLWGLRVTRVVLLVAALAAARALIVRRTRRPTLEVVALGVVWLLWQPHSTLRPHLFGWLFTLALVALLSHEGPYTRARLVALFSLVVAWMNFHSSGLIAIAMAGVYLAGLSVDGAIARASVREPLRRFAAVTAVVAIACLVQPEGARILGYPLLTRATGRGMIAEWLPLLRADTFEDVPRWPLTFLAVAFGWLVALVSRVRRRAPPVRFPGPWVALLGLLLTADVRRMTFFTILPVLFLVEELSAWLDRSPPRVFARPDQAWVPALGALATSLVAWVVVLPDWALTREHFLPGYAPDDALAFVRRARIEGRMFNPFMWGGFVEYRLWPTQRAFVDGRMDLFGRELVSDTFAIEQARPEAAELYAKYAIDWALLETQPYLDGAPLDPSGYALAYGDSTAVVLLRRGPRFDENVRRACALYRSGALPAALATFRVRRPRATMQIPSVLSLCAR